MARMARLSAASHGERSRQMPSSSTATVYPDESMNRPTLRGSAESSKRDRVAQLFRGRNRVFPVAAHLAAEHVSGARFEPDLEDFARVAFGALKAHPAEAAQRQSDDGVKGGSVAVPADRRARRIALHQDLRQLL